MLCRRAAAGPVIEGGGAVQITNYQGDKMEQVVRPEHVPAPLRGPAGECVMLNDLEAACYGVAVLSATSSIGAYFETVWGTKKPMLTSGGRFCVMAVGTGLGTAAIVSIRPHHVHIIPMEAGALPFASRARAIVLYRNGRLLSRGQAIRLRTPTVWATTITRRNRRCLPTLARHSSSRNMRILFRAGNRVCAVRFRRFF